MKCLDARVRPAALAAIAAAAMLTACDRNGSTDAPADPATDPAPDTAPLEPVTASNRSEGEVVELTLMRPDGSATELSALHGKPVLLVVDASWSEDWAKGLEVYPELSTNGSLQVVVVVVDEDPAVVDEAEAAGLSTAWDPQGAVAAKLSAATFPTLILLDPEGRVRWQAKGLDPAALRRAVDGG